MNVPNIRINLISVGLLGKVGMKVIFVDNEVILTKNNIFVVNGYCNHDLYVLNVFNNICDSASTSAYMIESIFVWYARLGHVNIKCIKNMQSLSLLSSLNLSNFDKCGICVETKITKRSCFSVNREIELLSLIHTDLGDLK